MAQKNRSEKMDVSKLSDEDIQDMFTEAYQNQIASKNAFDNFECICKRENGLSAVGPTVIMEVTVIGMAGTPTLDDYKQGKVIDSKTVIISREDKGKLQFNLDPKSIMSLNTNDYVVAYKSL